LLAHIVIFKHVLRYIAENSLPRRNLKENREEDNSFRKREEEARRAAPSV